MGEGVRAACVIGWPVRHSRSPLIHGYWIKQYKLDAAYRREEIAPEAFADFIAHLSERGYVGANITHPAQGGGAGDVGAGRPRACGRRCQHALVRQRASAIRPTPTSRASPPISTPAVPGWDKRAGDAVVLGAGGSARAIIYGLIERGIGKIHVVNRTPERAAGAAGALRPGGAARQRGGAAASAHPRRAARQHDLARHDRPAAARHRSRAAAASCRGRRSGLCPAGNAVAGGGPRPWAWPPPMGSACCCIRRCGAFSSGSGCGRR